MLCGFQCVGQEGHSGQDQPPQEACKMVTERGGRRVVPEETLMVLRTTDVNQGDKEGGREGRGGGSAGCVCVCVCVCV